MVTINSFFTRRFWVIFILGFSSGLPFSLTGITLQAWYAVTGVSLLAIGFLSLIGQPYLLKFLWAPLLDRYSLPFLGRRRGWILCLQLLLAASIFVMAFLQPQKYPWLIVILALVIALFSATQDIVIDAYRINILKPTEFGLGAALNSGGYRLAMIVSGALALVMAEIWGWSLMWMVMAAAMAMCSVGTYLAVEQPCASPPPSLKAAVIEPWHVLKKRPLITYILLFIVFYKLNDALINALGPTFLLREMRFSLMQVGLVYKVIGLLGTLLGTFIAGIWMIRLPLFKALFGFGVLQAFSSLGFMLLAIIGKNYSLMVAAVFFENLTQGMAAVAFIAFAMSLCDSRYTATQFALLTALAALARIIVGPFAAMLAEQVGWPMFYFYVFVLAFPGLILTWFLKDTFASCIPSK